MVLDRKLKLSIEFGCELVIILRWAAIRFKLILFQMSLRWLNNVRQSLNKFNIRPIYKQTQLKSLNGSACSLTGIHGGCLNVCQSYSQERSFLLPFKFFLSNGAHPLCTSNTQTTENENEIQRILSIPENKLHQLNIISLNDVIRVVKDIEPYSELLTQDQIQRLLKMAIKAVDDEFHNINDTVNNILNLLFCLKGPVLNEKIMVTMLRLSLKSLYHISNEDIIKQMEKHNIKLTQELCELLLDKCVQFNELEKVDEILKLIRINNFSMTENVYCSLILLNGKKGDLKGVHFTINSLKSLTNKVSPASSRAMIIAFTLCKEYEEAKEVLEIMNISNEKFSGNQFSDIVLAAVESGCINEALDFMNYILNSKTDVCEDRDLKKAILQLIHKKNLHEAVFIWSTQDKYKTPHLSSSGKGFIKELVKLENVEVDLVIGTLDKIVEYDVNSYAHVVALEASLFEKKVELAWALLRVLKKNGHLIKEHYFWPLFCLNYPDEDRTAKVLKILDGMAELEAPVGLDSLSYFVIPNLPLNDPILLLEMLYKHGINKSKVITPLMSTLLSKLMFDEVLQIADLGIPIFLMNHVMPFCYAYQKEPKNTLDTLKKLTNKLVGNKTFNKKLFLNKFVVKAAKISKGQLTEENVRTHVEKVFRERRVINDKVFDRLTDGSDHDLVADDSEENKKPDSQEFSHSIPHPNEMTLEELEGHLIELKHKKMNTRGVLRKLLLKYSAAKNQEKVSQTMKELKALGVEMSAGMLSTILYNHILEKEAESAIEAYYSLETHYPKFILDSYKVVDLCSLLAQQSRVQEAIEMMRDYIKKAPKEFHHKKSILHNCHRLLVECVDNDGYSSAREICSLLLTGGLASPTPILFGPLIKAKLNQKDVEGAVKEMEDLYSTYKILPMRLEVLIHLMKELYSLDKDSPGNEGSKRSSFLEDLIERAVSLAISSRGVKQAKHDILLAALISGHEKEIVSLVQKLEPDLDKVKVQDMCNYLVKLEKVDTLQMFLSVSKNSQKIDRMYICESLINVYYVSRESAAAMKLWSMMQEEDLRPSSSFMSKMSHLLGSNFTVNQSPVN